MYQDQPSTPTRIFLVHVHLVAYNTGTSQLGSMPAGYPTFEQATSARRAASRPQSIRNHAEIPEVLLLHILSCVDPHGHRQVSVK